MFAGDAGRTDTRGGDTLRTLVNPKTGSSAVPTGQLPFYFIFSFFIPPFISLRLHFLRHFASSLALLSLSLPCSFRGDRSPCSLCLDYYSRPRCFTARGWVSGDGGSVSSFTRTPCVSLLFARPKKVCSKDARISCPLSIPDPRTIIDPSSAPNQRA